MMTIGGIGDGLDKERNATRQGHGLESSVVPPQAGWLKDVPWFIILIEINLTRTTINRLLPAQKLTRIVVVNLHCEASSRMTVEMNRRQSQILASRRQDTPYVVFAFFNWSAWRALGNIVFSVTSSGGDTPTLTRDRDEMIIRFIFLEIGSGLGSG